MAAWVDFPAPSPPSKVMNLPRVTRRASTEPASPKQLAAAGSEEFRDGLRHVRIYPEHNQVDAFRNHAAGLQFRRRVERHRIRYPVRFRRNTNFPYPVALLDGRRGRAAVGDLRLDAVVLRIHGQKDHGVGFRLDRHAPLLAALTLASPTVSSFAKTLKALKLTNPQFRRLEGLFAALPIGVEPIHDGDDTPAVFHGRGGNAVAGSLGEPHFQPIRRDGRIEKRVLVLEGMCPVLELFLPEVAVIVGYSAGSRCMESFASSRAVIWLKGFGSPDAFCNIAFLEPERASLVGHGLRKRIFAAGQAFRDRDAGVIAILDDNAPGSNRSSLAV